MNIFERFNNAVTRRSKYEQHWTRPVGSPQPGTPTRQRARRAETARAFGMVNKSFPNDSRKARRQLARAYGAKAAREAMASERAKLTAAVA